MQFFHHDSSLRVNLDMAKLVYSWVIGRDKEIPGTVVRSSTIPEELGRISYLLSDKTGTLTQNEMVYKSTIIRIFYMFVYLQLPVGHEIFVFCCHDWCENFM